jgi:hypothetical protein
MLVVSMLHPVYLPRNRQAGTEQGCAESTSRGSGLLVSIPAHVRQCISLIDLRLDSSSRLKAAAAICATSYQHGFHHLMENA